NLLRREQALLFHPLIGMKLRQVVLTRVANDENNHGVFVGLARDAQGRSAVRAGRAAAKYAFYATQLARGFERLAIGDIQNFVHVLHVRVRGQNLLTDAFYQIRSRFGNLPGLFVFLVDRSDWVGADDFDVGVLFFQKTPGA